MYNSVLMVCECSEARIEFGDEVADKLKLSEDGTTILWPQPRDDSEDPQNVCIWQRKTNERRLTDLLCR
jgi:hypothetical protein